MEDLLVSGKELGHGPNRCYLGIFPNTYSGDPTLTFAGTIFLKKYYTFFDMSGYDANNAQSKLRVGIGKKNPNNTILESHYNKFYSDYDKSLSESDQSVFSYLPNHFTYRPISNPNVTKSNPTSSPQSENPYMIYAMAGGVTFLLMIILCCIVNQKRKGKRSNLGEEQENPDRSSSFIAAHGRPTH